LLRLLRALGIRRAAAGSPIIVVSGLPRSGTSMMMNMLAAGGLAVSSDRVRQADEDNPRGYFEDERVKDLERAPDKTWVAECRGKVVKVISFLLKDLPDTERYQVLFMHRDLHEVIASQNKMLHRRNEPVDETDGERMARAYRAHLVKVKLLLAERRNFDVLEVDYREAVGDPRATARRVARFLGRDLDVERMAGAVEPSLYRNRAQGEARADAP
jgi:hypothetical protein